MGASLQSGHEGGGWLATRGEGPLGSGNVRELQNVGGQALTNNSSAVLRPEALPETVRRFGLHSLRPHTRPLHFGHLSCTPFFRMDCIHCVHTRAGGIFAVSRAHHRSD